MLSSLEQEFGPQGLSTLAVYASNYSGELPSAEELAQWREEYGFEGDAGSDPGWEYVTHVVGVASTPASALYAPGAVIVNKNHIFPTRQEIEMAVEGFSP